MYKIKLCTVVLTYSKVMKMTMRNRLWLSQHDHHFSANRAIAVDAVVDDGDDGENHKCYAYPVMVSLNCS